MQTTALLALLLLVSCQDPSLVDQIVVQLGDEDLNAIKSSDLCSDGENCYLTFLPDAISDTVNIGIEGTSRDQCFKVEGFFPDRSPPELVQFVEFDLNTRLLTLTFSEVVRTTSVNFTAVTLQSSFDGGVVYNLTSGIVFGPIFSTTVVLELSEDDTNELKRINEICTRLENCWIFFTQNFIEDVAGNNILGLDIANIDRRRRALDVVVDITPPNVIAFDVNLNSQQITFFFDETVDLGTLDVTALVFSASANMSVNYTIANPLSLGSAAVTSFTIDVNDEDILNLKAIDNLFTGVNDTFLSHSDLFIDDQFGNDIDPRVIGEDALQVRNFTQDSTAPRLADFTLLDVDADRMQLLFDEPVDLESLNSTRIILRSAALTDPSAINITLSGHSSSRYVTPGRLLIEISFNDNDIRVIKLEPLIATDRSNSFVYLLAGAIEDTAGNPVSDSPRAFQASDHIVDSRGPELIYFSLNLTSEVLALSFNDIVDVVGTLDITEISVQADRLGTSGLSYTLVNSTSNSANGFSVVINLSEYDLNQIKAVPGLATNENNTFISFTAGALMDIFGANVISVLPTDAFRANEYFPDQTPPELRFFNLDFNRERLAFFFSETIDVNSFDVSLLTLQNRVSAPSRSYELTGGEVVSDQYVTYFEVELTREDLNTIKLYEDLAVSDSSTFLTFPRAVIVDANGNNIVEIPTNASENVAVFVSDSTPPVLRAFDLDMNIGQIMITFDETVNATTFRPDQVIIQSSNVVLSATSFYMLTNGSNSLDNSPIITVNITTNDLNAIKQNIEIATSMDDAYISLTELAVRDMNSIQFANVSAVQVTLFTPDRTNPELDSFILDLNLGVLRFTFSETVDSTTLQIPTIKIVGDSDYNDTNKFRDLSVGAYPNGSYTLSPNSTVLDIFLGRHDLDAIKQCINLGTELNNTFVVITNETVQDMNDNRVVPRTVHMSLQASLVIEDETPPELAAFSLDLNTGFLRVTFSETVNASSIDITGIQLLSNSSLSSEQVYTLMDSTVVLENSPAIEIELGEADLNLIKFRTLLAVDENSIFLQLAVDSARDMNRVAYINNSVIQPITPGSLIADTSRPEVVGFSLDLDLGILTLTFNEVINSSTLLLTNITLQNQEGSPTQMFTLNGGDLSGPNIYLGHPPVLNVTLDFDDLNSIKRMRMLAIDNESTYLSILDHAAFDLAPIPNSLLGEPATMALLVTEFTPDVTQPEFIYFELNMATGQLLLVFSETVDINTFNISQVTLQSDSNLLTSNQYYTLDTSMVSSTVDDTDVIITLEARDLNAIKLRTMLCTGRLDCFISLTPDTVLDMNDNPLVEVSDASAEMASNYTADNVPPRLLALDLDNNLGSLTLTFSEAVNVETLNISNIVLYASQEANTSDRVEVLTPGLFPDNTDTNSSNGVEVVLRLGYADLYDIQRKRGLATERADTFLAIATGSVLDMTGNSLIGIEANESLQVTGFIEDSTPPQLLEVLLDVNLGLLSLTFDETVSVPSISRDMIVLLAVNETQTMPEIILSATPMVEGDDDPVINITLTKPEIDELKLFTGLGTDSDNTYLHIMAGGLLDNSIHRLGGGNSIEAVTIQVLTVIPDTTRPMLEAFEIDLNSGLLFLYFDEPVNGSSINFGAITFQNAELDVNVTERFPLDNGTVEAVNGSLNGLMITVNLTTMNLNDIKLLNNLLVSNTTAFISVTSDLIRDMAGVPLLPPDPILQASVFVPDTNNPSLVAFGLDMNSGIVTLIFDEPVNISTLDIMEITLQQARVITTNTTMHSLQGGMLITSSNGLIVEFSLLDSDLNEIKRLQIGSESVTSFISFTSATIDDTVGNNVNQIMGRGVTLALYVSDTSPPMLDRFDLNLTMNTLTLYFSETVRARSLRIPELTLQDATGGAVYTLTTPSSTSTSVDGTQVIVDLGREDLNEIKLQEGLATSVDNTYISYTSAAISDMVGNPLVNRSLASPLPVTNFTADMISPQLESFILDLTNETLVLSFSETVNASSFNPTSITIQGSETIADSYVTLQYGVVGSNSDVLEVMLFTEDLNLLKVDLNLATDEPNTFISFDSQLITDMNSNPIEPIGNFSAMPVDLFVPDGIPPVLDTFHLNLNSCVLTLNFSETVSAPSLDVTAIVLQDDINSTNCYTLTGGTVQLFNSSVIDIAISEKDKNLINERFTLATQTDNTFISLGTNAIQDMNENYNEEIPKDSGIQVEMFTPDGIAPILLNFTLDLNRGEIIFLFSETVDVSTINFTEIIIISNPYNASINTTQYTLMDGFVVNPRNFTDVTVMLIPDDLNAIKADLMLATGVDDTFLAITSSLIQDMNENAIVGIPREEAEQAYNYIPDVTRPELRAFSLNLTSDILSLFFTETVSAVTFNQTSFIVYDSRNGMVSHTLSDSELTSEVDSTEIFVQLSYDDANEIKRLSLATSPEDTFLAVGPLAIEDTSGNVLEEVPPSEALNVTEFYADNLDPVLLTFNFNLSSGEIVMTFSETVNASTLIITGFSLQSVSNTSLLSDPQGVYQLTPASSSSDVNSHIITITVEPFDLNLIKRDTTLAISNMTTYISILSGSIQDMNGNGLEAVPPESAIMVSEFTNDMVFPELIAFSLDLTPGSDILELELVFSETVNASSLQPTSFAFSNSINGTVIFNPTGGNVSTLDSTVTTVYILPEDLSSIRLLDGTLLLTLPETSYLSVRPGAVFDMADNPVVPILSVNGLININESNADLNPPVLEEFTLDLNLGAFFLTFSEPVYSDNFKSVNLTLHSGQYVGFNTTLGSFYTLTGDVNTSTPDSDNVVVLEITEVDFNRIAQLTGLAVSESTTFVSILRGITIDYSENEARFIAADNALPVAQLIPDRTDPILRAFEVNLTSEVITFYFSETINADTVDVTMFTFQNSISSATLSYPLTDSTVLTMNSPELSIQLSETDSNGIKFIDGLLTSINNTFLSVDREALMDMSGNELTDIFPTGALPAQGFFGDMVRPQLVNYTIDLNEGLILLTFDETVRETALDAKQITLFSFNNNSVFNLTLSGGFSNTGNNPMLSISFTLQDLNELKRLSFCTVGENCYLSFTQDLVEDMVGNPVVEIPEELARSPTVFTPDTTSPELITFVQIDYNLERVTLLFSETLNIESLDFTAITFQSLFANTDDNVILTSGTVPAVNTSTIVIQLDQADLDALKLDSAVCVFRGNCYVSITSSFAEDMNGNNLTSVEQTFPGFLVVDFVRDEIKPQLLAFDLDLALGTLLLEFSEPVDYMQIDFSAVRLQGVEDTFNTTDLVVFPLSADQEIVVRSTRILLINLSAGDFEQLKASRYFIDRNTTYISILSGAVSDIAFFSNSIVEINETNALQVRNFTGDVDGPILFSFELDYITNQLLLMFNEPVLVTSFNFTEISFSDVQVPTSGDEVYQLTGGEVVNIDTDFVGLMDVIVALNLADTTALKSSRTLATERNNTYISLTNTTVLNTFGEYNMPIQGLRAANIRIDISVLMLTSFTLDMNIGVLLLSFNDVVRSSSFDPRGITLQSAALSNDNERGIDCLQTVNQQVQMVSSCKLI